MSGIFGTVNNVERALGYHLQRHNVIASNVANVDTPGFAPQELLRLEETELNHQVRMRATDERHLGTPGHSPDGELGHEEEYAVRPGNDGNAISLEREMSKLAANDLRYDGAARLVAKQIGILRYAANGGQGG